MKSLIQNDSGLTLVFLISNIVCRLNHEQLRNVHIYIFFSFQCSTHFKDLILFICPVCLAVQLVPLLQGKQPFL